MNSREKMFFMHEKVFLVMSSFPLSGFNPDSSPETPCPEGTAAGPGWPQGDAENPGRLCLSASLGLLNWLALKKVRNNRCFFRSGLIGK
jgi:hypothetical protein